MKGVEPAKKFFSGLWGAIKWTWDHLLIMAILVLSIMVLWYGYALYAGKTASSGNHAGGTVVQTPTPIPNPTAAKVVTGGNEEIEQLQKKVADLEERIKALEAKPKATPTPKAVLTPAGIIKDTPVQPTMPTATPTPADSYWKCAVDCD